ncbi:Domain of unknown function DUF3533 [Lasallia pustulata]|uniref:DUF3533 domain-containing protein n=1 Tax=Lasallia pustulata TaxID=136370 RepID=A0A1W5DB44_9LECA|nr:Domain of unknown function DUF3533 [Lasallia pustulata]
MATVPLRPGDPNSPLRTFYITENGGYEPDSSSDQTLGERHTSIHTSPDNEEHAPDGGEKGGKEEPPKPVGFWDHSLHKVRLEVFGAWTKTTLILATFILAVLSLYWGVLFHVESNLSSLVVYVVDFDGQQAPYTGVTPLIGPMITQTTEAIVANSPSHLGYGTLPPSAFDNDPMAVRRAVFEQHAWAAIVINANATALLQQAVQTGNASYDPLGACQVIYVEARDQDTISSYISPQLNALQNDITARFGQMWTAKVLGNSSISRANLHRAPQALSPAIGFSQFNLRPFGPPQAVPAVSIGLIYLIILAFFSFTFFLPIHMKFVTSPGHPPLKFQQLIVWRWVATVAAYFFMSLAYSLISLAFQIPFGNEPGSMFTSVANPNAYGKATFVVFWMINWVGMIALGLACENVAMVIGQPWTAMWLIFWVISNVSTGFYAIELAPRFYSWGYAWPLHNIVEASRSTLFDLHSRIGLNLGILFAWVAVNTVLFPICCNFMRWKTMRSKSWKKKESEQKK